MRNTLRYVKLFAEASDHLLESLNAERPVGLTAFNTLASVDSALPTPLNIFPCPSPLTPQNADRSVLDVYIEHRRLLRDRHAGNSTCIRQGPVSFELGRDSSAKTQSPPLSRHRRRK